MRSPYDFTRQWNICSAHHILIAVILSNRAGCSKPTAVRTVDQSSLSAALTIKTPGDIAGEFPALFAMFSALPIQSNLITMAPSSKLGMDGCIATPMPSVTGELPTVAVARRGNCSFTKKALLAQQAGAKGLVIVSDTDGIFVMGKGNSSDAIPDIDIFVVMVGKHLGDRILARSASTPVVMSIAVYHPQSFDLAQGLILVLATTLIIGGAQFASSDLRKGSIYAPPKEEVVELDEYFGIMFFVIGSIALVTMFFLMKFMIYFVIFGFCSGGVNCITQILGIILKHLIPELGNKANIPKFVVSWTGPVCHADVIGFVSALGVVCSWLVHRNDDHGWIFQDIIGSAFLVWIQRTLRIPSMKIAALILPLMFIFDIFWVFISPVLFKKSVMVSVATGGHEGIGGGTNEAVPMLLRLPSFGDPLGNYRMLGFGDVALPGILVSYLRRYDVRSQRTLFEGYFLPSVVGYFVGLSLTLVALFVMKMGQPALLYLVPGTLGTTVILAYSRGELRNLWEGKACPPKQSPGFSNLEAQQSAQDSRNGDD